MANLSDHRFCIAIKNAIAVLLSMIDKCDRRFILSQFEGTIKRAYDIKPLQNCY